MSTYHVLRKYVPIIGSLDRPTSGPVRAYHKLLPPFVTANEVSQGCLSLRFRFNFFTDDFLERSAVGFPDVRVELLQGTDLLLTSYQLTFFLTAWRLKQSDTAWSLYHQSVKCCFRIGEISYLSCTWKMKNLNLLNVSSTLEAEFLETGAWCRNIHAYIKFQTSFLVSGTCGGETTSVCLWKIKFVIPQCPRTTLRLWSLTSASRGRPSPGRVWCFLVT